MALEKYSFLWIKSHIEHNIIFSIVNYVYYYLLLIMCIILCPTSKFISININHYNNRYQDWLINLNLGSKIVALYIICIGFKWNIGGELATRAILSVKL